MRRIEVMNQIIHEYVIQLAVWTGVWGM